MLCLYFVVDWAAAEEVRHLMGDKSKIFFYVSPYARAHQTLDVIENHLGKSRVSGVSGPPHGTACALIIALAVVCCCQP